MYHLNFESAVDPIESDIYGLKIVGGLSVVTDPVTNRVGGYFDGGSHLRLPSVPIHENDFSIQCIFRSDTVMEERAVFGSYGYRIAFRQDPRQDTVSFWANFPSSTNPQRVQFDYDPSDWCKVPHYFAVSKQGSIFTVQLDQQVKTLDYKHSYWDYEPFIGAYYDKMYGFQGFIYQYKFDLSALTLDTNNVPNTIF